MDWLPEDHLAFFVLDVVKELDLRSIHAHYERDHRGAAPYDPRMMVALLLYAYCMGTPSSRRIERKTHEDVAFRVICGGQQPDHTRISEFRRIHLKSLSGLFFQVLKLCQAAGLVQLGHVAIDGTKVKANASKHKAMSYDRMLKAEAELQEKVKILLAAAEKADAADDKHYGKGKRGEELPEELRRAESRLKKIQEAKRALEAEAQARKEREAASKATTPTDGDDGGGKTGSGPKDDASVASSPASEELPSHRVPAYADGTPKPKAQRNFTDPESRIQKANDGFVQGFNCQAAVDEAHQIIVGQAVTNQPPDVEHFAPLLADVIENCGAAPATATADAGYYSEANTAYAAAHGVDVYIATGRTKHQADPPVSNEKPAEEMTAKERMTQKVKSEKGARIYSRRKCTVEPVFGQIKHARGFRQFLLRGVEKVRGEWSLICGGHNLLKLHRAAVAG
jgi:transposase